ncbi:hypothetical protein RHGRI_001273 [Rhododendron griersonianum]|uniref:hAT-like transposase RNase-H fold domain-containing protein n=1 Tax=Rhododendron griersonianum TaxID=479676 RepID=A0AAV6LLS1_9ERIC|nr:hypothetical protein RHGRI_001273 [Rhododendron griersonianum]
MLGLFLNDDAPSSLEISDSNRTNPMLVKVNQISQNKQVTALLPTSRVQVPTVHPTTLVDLPPQSTSSVDQDLLALFLNGDAPSSLEISDSNRTNPMLVKVNRISQNKQVTGSLIGSILGVPTWESNSTSTEIESNEAQLSTLDSSQAETESNLPTNEPEELGYTFDGDKILSKAIDNKQKFIIPSLLMGEGKMANIQSYSYDPEVARKQLAYMIIMHEYPLSMVEHVGFRRFCHALQLVFHVISRNTMKRDIFKIYDVEKLKTMRLMERNKSRVSLTTDMWTSISKKRGFMVITSHIIDDSWKLQSRILRLSEWVCCGIDVVEEMALNMLEKYDKYWNNTHGFLAIAVVLDPRFKMSLIKYYYKRIYGEHGVGIAEDIRRRCYDLLTLYQGKSSSKDRSESSSKAPPSTYLRDRTSLSDYLDQQKKTKTVHVKLELDCYLEEEQLPMCDDFDILAW